MKCSRCSAELPASATYCFQCGQNFQSLSSLNASPYYQSDTFSYLPVGTPPWPTTIPTLSSTDNTSSTLTSPDTKLDLQPNFNQNALWVPCLQWLHWHSSCQFWVLVLLWEHYLHEASLSSPHKIPRQIKQPFPRAHRYHNSNQHPRHPRAPTNYQHQLQAKKSVMPTSMYYCNIPIIGTQTRYAKPHLPPPWIFIRTSRLI